jgi:hypothetical protein
MPRKGISDHAFFLKEFVVDHSTKSKDTDMEKHDEDDEPFTKDTPAPSQLSGAKELGKRKESGPGASGNSDRPTPKRPIRFVISKH